MKYIKTLGLAAVAAAAMMAFAGIASATEVTSPTGSQYNGTIKAELKSGTKATLTSSFIGEVICEESIVEGKISKQGSGITAEGPVETLDFKKCNGVVTTLKGGKLTAHGEGGYNGILTSDEAEVTVELFGLHCIFSTNETSLGTVTGGTPATFKAASASIPRTGGRSGVFCGSSAVWKAEYNVVTPGTLLID